MKTLMYYVLIYTVGEEITQKKFYIFNVLVDR